MASAVEQLTNNYETSQPVSFYDYYNAYGRDHSSGQGKWNDTDPYSFGGWFQNLLYGTRTSAEKEYENYLAGYEYERNRKATSAQNELTMAREDTETQRKVADIQAAGLNPYLFLTSGSMAGVSSQASAPSYKRASSKKKDESKIASSALRILAIIALKSML